MKLTNSLATGLLGAIATLSPTVLAIDATPKTLQQCATLLPAGKTYSFQISGTIDTLEAKPVLQGTFNLDDGTQVSRPRSEGEAFGKCIASLMGI